MRTGLTMLSNHGYHNKAGQCNALVFLTATWQHIVLHYAGTCSPCMYACLHTCSLTICIHT